jgi:hypothetical protein
MFHRPRAGVHFPRHFIHAVLVAALVAPLPVLASGTAAAGGGSNTSYNAGKLIYSTKLACDGCPFAGQSPDAAQLERLASDPAVANALTPSERELAADYLKRRLKLN